MDDTWSMRRVMSCPVMTGAGSSAAARNGNSPTLSGVVRKHLTRTTTPAASPAAAGSMPKLTNDVLRGDGLGTLLPAVTACMPLREVK